MAAVEVEVEVEVVAVAAASRLQDGTLEKDGELSECFLSMSQSITIFHFDLDHHWC